MNKQQELFDKARGSIMPRLADTIQNDFEFMLLDNYIDKTVLANIPNDLEEIYLREVKKIRKQLQYAKEIKEEIKKFIEEEIDMKAVYRMKIDCGRQGELEGVFIADKEDVKILIESKIEVYFGEVLGKHSEVFGIIEESELEMVTDNEEVIKVMQDNFLSSGLDPFAYPATQAYLSELGLEDSEMEVQEVVDLIKEK